MLLKKIKKIGWYFFYNPVQLFDSALTRICFLFPDKLYLSLRFRCQMGYWINWKNPKTFSEKLQWLKLYNRRPEYTMMVDKYAVKDYVARLIGKEYIIPTLGVWDEPEDIDWDKLPDKFVLKTTHGGGSCGVFICRDKSEFDKQGTIKKLKKALNADIYSAFREWPYKNVPRRVIAEVLLERGPCGESEDVPDYKFFCFGGTPMYCQVISGRSSQMSVDFYDMDWVHQPFHEPQRYPFSEKAHRKPNTFERMKVLAEVLSAGHSFLRVDFYEVGEKIFFGELTFFPTSGMGGFSPDEWDVQFGKHIKLSDETL